MQNVWLKIRTIFLSYSRGDRVGIIILSILIVISLALKIVLGRMEPTPLLTQEEFDEILLEWSKEKDNTKLAERLSYFSFNPNTVAASQLDSLAIPEQIKRNLVKYRAAGGSFKTKEDIRKLYGMTDSIFLAIEPYIEIPKYQPSAGERKVEIVPEIVPEGNFDPNTASYELLKKYGLNDFQAKNIVAYRESGGSYAKPEDLLKIYGLDSVTFSEIHSFIGIEPANIPESETIKEELHIEINRADTTELMRISGIGQVYAKRIIKYRDLLGGFYNTNQLQEVYGFTEELLAKVEPCLYVDTTLIKQIRINYADFSEMIRHPYFDKPKVNAILNEKDHNGPIKNITELTHLKAIDSEFIAKIKPYVSCR